MKNVQLLTYRADLKSSLKELFRRTEQPQNVLEYEKSGGIHKNRASMKNPENLFQNDWLRRKTIILKLWLLLKLQQK